jgi:hypothetical protein
LWANESFFSASSADKNPKNHLPSEEEAGEPEALEKTRKSKKKKEKEKDGGVGERGKYRLRSRFSIRESMDASSLLNGKYTID